MIKANYFKSHVFCFLLIGLLSACSSENNKNSVLNKKVEMQVDSSLLVLNYAYKNNLFSILIPKGWQAIPDSAVKSNQQDMIVEKIYQDSSGSMLIISEIKSNILYDSLITQKGRELRANAAAAGISVNESAFAYNDLSISQWIIRNPKGSLIRFVTRVSEAVMQFDYILSDNNFKVAESSFGSIKQKK